MPYKLKSNEEVTEACEQEEKHALKVLRSRIEMLTSHLRSAQNKHKKITGKRHTLL